MSQSTVNPYPDLGGTTGQFASGMAAIIGGLGAGAQISDLVTQVYNYVKTVYYPGATPSTQVQEEIKSIAYTVINSYVNGLIPSGQSTLSARAMGFANMLIGPAVTQKVPIYLTNWIGDVEDNITKAGLSVDEQRPLLMAVEIGPEAYTYWKAQTALGGTSAWSAYFILNNNDYNSISAWVAATMEGAIAGYCANYNGLLETTINKETNTMMSALIGALTISAGKVIFGWIPRIQPAMVTAMTSMGGGMDSIISHGGGMGRGGSPFKIWHKGVENGFGYSYMYTTYATTKDGQDIGGDEHQHTWAKDSTEPSFA